ncbi:MAG: 6-carboxytetrahydropterin synthase, partial [Thiobacillus sp.]
MNTPEIKNGTPDSLSVRAKVPLVSCMVSARDLRENAAMDIFRIFHLQCARRLPALPASHPCSRLHGHSFRVELTV